MRAHIRTEVTLDTVVRIPNRYIDCDTTFLVCSGTRRSCTIYIIGKCRYRQVVTLLSIDSSLNGVDKLNNVCSSLGCVSHLKSLVRAVLPAFRNLNLYNVLSTCIDSSPVLHNNVFTLTAVGCLCSSLHQFDRSLLRNNICQLEECGLKDGIDTGRTHTGLDTQFNTVDGVEFNLVVSDELLNLSR